VNVVTTLVRKHLVEAKWPLALSSAAFFAVALLTSWDAKRSQGLLDSADPEKVMRRLRYLRALGGALMDYSATATQVCWYNHPIVILTVLFWAVSRASSAVAGEVERGTVDVTFSRPVTRLAFLASHVLFAALGLTVLVGSLVVGDRFGGWYFGLKSAPTLLTLLRPGAQLVMLGAAVFGYTLPFSAADSVRWRPSLAGAALTLAGLLALTLAPQFENVAWLENLSVFQFYAPVTVALKGEPLGHNAAVLGAVFGVGIAASYVVFARRDLPSNS